MTSLREIRVTSHRRAERDEIRVEREVVGAVDADTADRANEERRQVAADNALRTRTSRSHMRIFVHAATEEQVVVVSVQRGAEHVVASGVLELAHGTDRSAVRHEADTRQEPSSAIEAVVQVDQVVSGEGT